MTVPSTLYDLSTTEASNFPLGGEAPSASNGPDDFFRAQAAIIKRAFSVGADIASASTITPDGSYGVYNVTGTTAITTIASTNSWNGRVIRLMFAGVLTLTHSSNLLMPGLASVITAANDTATFIQVSSGVWRCIDYQFATGQPIAGIIQDYGGTSAPAGYLACDGTAVSRTTYARLFAAIGTTWGVGDGSTTFNVPNLARRVTVGSGGSGTGTLSNTVGSTGGEENHTQTTAEMPTHSHGVTDPGHTHPFGNASNIANGGGSPSAFNAGSTGNTSSATTGISIQNAGSGNAFNVMQPSAVVLKIISI
jgi:microcystin-dependent protein